MTKVKPPSRMANTVSIRSTVWIGSVINSPNTGTVAADHRVRDAGHWLGFATRLQSTFTMPMPPREAYEVLRAMSSSTLDTVPMLRVVALTLMTVANFSASLLRPRPSW